MRLLDDLQTSLTAIDAAHLRRICRIAYNPADRNQRISVSGEAPCDILSSYGSDYFDLAAHPALAETMTQGTRRHGFDNDVSHLASDHSVTYTRLEAYMTALQAEHILETDTLFFHTDYMANLAVVNAMAQADGIRPADGYTIFSDVLNHASLTDGVQLSRTSVKVYLHVDVATLGTLLTASTGRNKLIVTDGVFSMDGDITPLPKLFALAERYDAQLIVNDARGLDVLGGNGVGVLSHFELYPQYLIYTGTSGKTAGRSGVTIVAHRLVID